jgi:hypothetical protein
MTQGWRWWQIHDGRLMSPLASNRRESIYLPRDCRMDSAYFLPYAQDCGHMLMFIRCAAVYKRQEQGVFALTLGTVAGPFRDDPTLHKVRSVQAAQYTATEVTRIAAPAAQRGALAAQLAAYYPALQISQTPVAVG